MIARGDQSGIRSAIAVGAVGPAEALLPVSASGDTRQELHSRLARLAPGEIVQARILSKSPDGSMVLRIAGVNVQVSALDARGALPSTSGQASPLASPNNTQLALPAASRSASDLASQLHSQLTSQPGSGLAAQPAARPAANPALPSVLISLSAGRNAAQAAEAEGSFANRGTQGYHPDGTSYGTSYGTNSRASAAMGAATDAGVAHASGNAGVGDTISLTLAALGPRPTFRLVSAPIASSPDTTLSAASLMISRLLNEAPHEGEAAVVVRLSPLLPAESTGAPLIAAALHQALAASGLFYESHVALWEEGRLPLAELMQEPQAMLKPGASEGEKSALISQQLQLHEQQKLLWQGPLWPGRHLEWLIEPPGGDGHASRDPEQQTCWSSKVRFESPALGNIEADIVLTEGRVRMHVKTTTESAALALRQHGAMLAGALDAAGSPLDSLTIKPDGTA